MVPFVLLLALLLPRGGISISCKEPVKAAPQWSNCGGVSKTFPYLVKEGVKVANSYEDVRESANQLLSVLKSVQANLDATETAFNTAQDATVSTFNAASSAINSAIDTANKYTSFSKNLCIGAGFAKVCHDFSFGPLFGWIPDVPMLSMDDFDFDLGLIPTSLPDGLAPKFPWDLPSKEDVESYPVGTNMIVPLISSEECEAMRAILNQRFEREFADADAAGGFSKCDTSSSGGMLSFGGNMLAASTEAQCNAIVQILEQAGFTAFHGCFVLPKLKLDGDRCSVADDSNCEPFDMSFDAKDKLYVPYYESHSVCNVAVHDMNAEVTSPFAIVRSNERIGVDASTKEAYTEVEIGEGKPSVCFVDTPIFFSPIKLSRGGTNVSEGCFEDITYTLSNNAPPSLCIRPKTGVVVGSFSTVELHTFSVIAVDSGGKRNILENFTIDVNPLPQFQFATGERVNGTIGHIEYYQPMFQKEVFVGDTINLAPLRIKNATLSRGFADDITYSLSSNAPPSWFVNPETGETFGMFLTNGTKSFSLQARDKGGSEKVLENLTFVVKTRPTFSVKLLSPLVGGTCPPGSDRRGAAKCTFRTRNSSEFYNYTHAPTVAGGNSVAEFIANRVDCTSTYVIAPPQLKKRNRKNKIAWTLDASNENNDAVSNSSTFFIQPYTGIISARFNNPGNYTLSLSAVNDDNNRLAQETELVETFHFQAIALPDCHANESLVEDACKPFNLVRGKGREKNGTLYTDPDLSPNFAVGDDYRISRWKINQTATVVSKGLIGEIHYAFDMSEEKIPDGFFLDPNNGEMFFKFNDNILTGENATVKIVLNAIDSGGATVLAEEMKMVVRHKDTDVPSYGPNGKDCAPNSRHVDEILFDKHFTCKCSDGMGANCDIPRDSSKNKEGREKMIPAMVSVAFVAVFCIGYTLLRRRSARKATMQPHDFEVEVQKMVSTGEFTAAEEVHVPREIKRSYITLTGKVGEGAFGEVWKGILDESKAGGVPGYLVAVKQCQEGNSDGAEDLKKEAAVMAQVRGHPNVVSLIGVVTSGEPLYLIVSYCEFGSLVSFLRDRKFGRPSEQVSLAEKVKMAQDVANGMLHLVKCHFVHRDLAARNVLVDSQFICKVADFGLSRTIAVSQENGGEEYYRSHGGTFALRWTAPEAMENLKFTTHTDIWSYGIVLTEILNDGDQPYAGLDNALVMTRVMAGKKHDQPEGCPDQLFNDVILPCWNSNPMERPSFQELVNRLSSIAPNLLQESTRDQRAYSHLTVPANGAEPGRAATAAASNAYNRLGGPNGSSKGVYRHLDPNQRTSPAPTVRASGSEYHRLTSAPHGLGSENALGEDVQQVRSAYELPAAARPPVATVEDGDKDTTRVNSLYEATQSPYEVPAAARPPVAGAASYEYSQHQLRGPPVPERAGDRDSDGGSDDDDEDDEDEDTTRVNSLYEATQSPYEVPAAVQLAAADGSIAEHADARSVILEERSPKSKI